MTETTEACSNPTCAGPQHCVSPHLSAVCINLDCPEHELRKTACHFDLPPAEMRCGGCGKPCEFREDPAATAE